MKYLVSILLALTCTISAVAQEPPAEVQAVKQKVTEMAARYAKQLEKGAGCLS